MVGCLLTALAGCKTATDEVERPPNLLLVTLCSARADRTGFMGYTRDTTPTLDRLAEEGIVFERAWTAGIWTQATHASMLTGRLPGHHGLIIEGQSLGVDVPMLPDILGLYGYTSAAAVQEATGLAFNPQSGITRGFEAFLAPRDPRDWSPDGLVAWLRASRPTPFLALVHLRYAHFPYWNGEPWIEEVPEELASSLAAHTPLYQPKDARPVMLTGEPYTVLKQYTAREGHEVLDALYDSGLRRSDQALGELLDAMDRAGLLENTVVVVVGDHGEQLAEEGQIGHTGNLATAVAHVPMVVHLPNGYGAGLRIEGDVSQIDIAPTLLELAGAPPHSSMDGRSLVALMRGEELPPRAAVTQMATNNTLGERTMWDAVVLDGVRLVGRADGKTWQTEILDEHGQAVAAQLGPARLQTLVRWRLQLTEESTSGSQPVELTPAAKRIAQQQGYW